MNINALPDEILVRILSFLSPSDRLESALTCRRWAQAVARAPPLLRDICLVIKTSRAEEAETVFANSQRHYENLRLYAESLFDFNATCWMKVGPSLHKLHIKYRKCSPRVFYSILQACSNLESLTIDSRPSEATTFQLSELPQGTNLESIQKSMRNMRHLQLDYPVNADVLERFLILMPNVSSIGLTSSGRTSDLSSRLPNMLGTSRKITKLSLRDTNVNQDDCEQLVRISSSSVRILYYSGKVPASTVLDAVSNCSMLRDLRLSLDRAGDTRFLHNLLAKVPDLESFSLNSCKLGPIFRREDLTPIFDLRKLRNLNLLLQVVSDSNTRVPFGIVGNISRMISLESLGFAFGVVDSTCFRILASMPNLRVLKILNLRWDAKCLQTVLFGLRKLRTLSIGDFSGRLSKPVMRDWHSELEPDTSISPDRFRPNLQRERKFSSLEILRMLHIPLNDACLGLITAHHSRMRAAYFRGCYNITGAGLVTLFQNEPLLEVLQVFHINRNLDDTFLERIGELCRRLRWLEVCSPSRISSQAEEEFRLRRPRVKCSFRFPHGGC